MDKSSWLDLSVARDRDLRFLLLSMSVRRVAIGFMGVVSAIYFALLGFSPINIGFLISIGTLISAVHHIFFGVLSDRYGRKPFLLLGALSTTARLVIFASTRNFWLIAFGQGIGAMGTGVGPGQPAVGGYITDKVEKKKRVSTLSTFAITNAITASIGSGISGLPYTFQNILSSDLISAHVPLFIFGIILSLISFLFLLPVKDIPKKKVEKAREGKGMFKTKSRNEITKFSLVRATSGLGGGLITSLLPLYFFIRFAVGSDALGPIYALASFLSIFTYPFVPFVSAKLDETVALASSRAISAIIIFGFALTNFYPLAAVLLVLFRLVLKFTTPIRLYFATNLVNPEETATAIGFSNFAGMGISSLTPTLVGYMFEVVSLSLPFFMGGSLMILNGLLYYTFFKKRNIAS